MLIKFQNNISLALIFMSCILMVRTAIIKPLNVSHKSQQIFPQTAANHRDEVIYPLLSHNPAEVAYYNGVPTYNVLYNDDGDNYQDVPAPLTRSGDEFKLDQRLPNEGDYDYDNPPPTQDQYNRQQKGRKKPKKLYKAIERVYYYPQDDPQAQELSENKEAIHEMKEMQMKDIMPDNDYYNDDPDANDHQERQEFNAKKDLAQMDRNPPRQDFEEPEDTPEFQDMHPEDSRDDGTQTSIAQDVQEFGNEAVKEANNFDKFLDNLRKFAVNSEKEYSQPRDTEEQSNDDSVQNIDPEVNTDVGIGGDIDIGNYGERVDPNPTYRDSLAAHAAADDSSGEYDKVSNYGNPDEYDSEKIMYQNQKETEPGSRGGHRYHKDRKRRKPKKQDTNNEELYEQRDREVTGLIDSEPEEGDYLSNVDVVKQLKNSEEKYNTGIEPVYSSKRDFEEVTRLEKMIENVALLNKQKEKAASGSHDKHQEVQEGNESKVNKVKAEK